MITRHTTSGGAQWLLIHAVVACLALSWIPGHGAGAQGTLSTQGLGYPLGQLSTRAEGAGGALGEMDPWSPLNDAAVADFSTKILSFQLEQEYRSVAYNGSTQGTDIARYPIVFGAIPVGHGWAASFGSSTLLDRSWLTSITSIDSIGPDTTTTDTRKGSNGALNDVRVAAGWSNRSWLHIGLAVHGITGRNVVTSAREFADTIHFSNYTQSQTIEYRGTAVSAGAELVASNVGVLAFDYRYGGPLRALFNDTTVGHASVPDRFGASLAFTKIPGATFALRAVHDTWSALGPLTSDTAQPRNTWDLSAGGELTGPRLGSRALVLRAGIRDRTLPYLAADSVVRERSVTLGGTTFFAGGRLTLDFAVIRALYDASLPVSERAWTFSFGLSARP